MCREPNKVTEAKLDELENWKKNKVSTEVDNSAKKQYQLEDLGKCFKS